MGVWGRRHERPSQPDARVPLPRSLHRDSDRDGYGRPDCHGHDRGHGALPAERSSICPGCPRHNVAPIRSGSLGPRRFRSHLLGPPSSFAANLTPRRPTSCGSADCRPKQRKRWEHEQELVRRHPLLRFHRAPAASRVKRPRGTGGPQGAAGGAGPTAARWRSETGRPFTRDMTGMARPVSVAVHYTAAYYPIAKEQGSR